MSSLSEILDEYRRHADERLQGEVTKFRALSAGDQREMLFWMAIHSGAAINNLTLTLLQVTNPKGSQQ